MCGITGFFSTSPVSAPESLLHGMLTVIEHRGPDGSGTAVFSHAGLGHVRLAIIDVAGGVQPMSSEEGRYWISFNGELYNFQEIRRELQQEGCLFRTNSDTEVILQAFVRKGLACLQRFRGMFAIAIWDESRREGFLVRDRFGIKPLYYTQRGEQTIFGSEIKSLLCFPGVKASLNLQALHLLMNFRYIPGNRTMFRNIFHLEPGHYLHWKDGRGTIHRWWRRDRKTVLPALDDIRNTLVTAVERQLVSDVPLGSYLSAGIDSATILALVLKNVPKRAATFPTFTIKAGDSPDEHTNAAETARIFGVNNIQEEVAPDLEHNLPRVVWHLEVPKVNAYQSALVARLACKHVKVALSGLGGDEIFLGYNIHRYLDRLYGVSRTTGPLLKWFGLMLHPPLSRLGLVFEEYARGAQALAALPDFSRTYGIFRNVWDSSGNRSRIYGPRMLAQPLEDSFIFLQKQWDGGKRSPVEQCAEFELRHKMVNDLLLQEDRLSMAFGLEVRVPFLDEDLVDLISRIPAAVRIPGGRLKTMMKETVAPWVPITILDRPKSGFQLPIHKVFHTHLRPLALTWLSPERVKKDGLFNYNFIASVLEAKPHYRLRWHYFLIYLMIGTTIWLDLFERNESPPAWS